MYPSILSFKTINKLKLSFECGILRPQDVGHFACATANFLTHFKISIAVLENVPPDAGSHLFGGADSAITEFGIKRQNYRSGISYNGNCHNGISHNSIFSKSRISYNGNCYKGISYNVIFSKSGISIMETAIMESPIIPY
jgi:hypothetical protein